MNSITSASFNLRWTTKQKINVRPSDCRFFVNKNKRKVICLLEHTRHNFITFMDQNNCFHDMLYSEEYWMPNRFIGVANCSLEDKWDEELGKKIAFSRMKDKYNASFFKRAEKYVNNIDKIFDEQINRINELGAKFSASSQHRHEVLDAIISPKLDNQ